MACATLTMGTQRHSVLCYSLVCVIATINCFISNAPLGDGLRADLLYNQKPFPNIPDSPEIVAPYLHQVARERGAFGVSHTHVPTESRPGHVAIIAGMYEDVSAVTKVRQTEMEMNEMLANITREHRAGKPIR